MTVTENAPSPDAPRWDVSKYFPGVDSREYTDAEEQIGARVGRLAALYDRHDVRRGSVPDDPTTAIDEVLAGTNEVLGQLGQMRAYLNAFVSTDSTDSVAQAAMSRLERVMVDLSNLTTRFDAWTEGLDVDELIAASDAAAAHEWPLRKGLVRAEHQMSEAEEELAALMSVTGSSAWSRLYGDVSSSIRAVVDLPDGPQSLPIFAIRGLATNPDTAVRQAAYVAEHGAWEQHSIPIAAALNAIKGEQQELALRRGWPSVLAAQVFGQAVDQDTLAALQSAMVASFPDFRRYLRTKSGLLGHDGGLPWYDLFAPVGEAAAVDWSEAVERVYDAFGSYSTSLRGLAERAVGERWIDVAPRAGKRGGAFCMPMGDGDSRVLLNFDGSADGVMTLAHELGHAYHNVQLGERTPIQRGTPSTLAETASIFCETLMVHHGLEALEGAQRLALLDIDLSGTTQVIVDIHSRFLFESSVFERRRKSTLSVGELCELMADAQQATYGEGLHEDVRHRWMWAAKPHYYGSVFYNWPYAFGLLFGLGLYARFMDDPEAFRGAYDDLLSSTGLAPAAELGARFGIDVRDEAFWSAGLDVVRARIDDYSALADDTAIAGS
ncbi:MAG: M3 family oligoendopeptidase [Acidimicrobiales bacterium]